MLGKIISPGAPLVDFYFPKCTSTCLFLSLLGKQKSASDIFSEESCFPTR